jgi:AraC-like DNA-binding protein
MPQEFTSRLLRGEMIREPDATQEDMDRLRFENWRTDLGSANSDMLKIVESEVQARLRRLAIRVAQSPRTRSDNVAPADKQSIDKVEQIARHIGEHYHDSITIDDIGRVVELHPKYAASLFKKHCGMTIGEYITEHRLSQAKRLLATTELKIVDIAFEAGFNSVSRFYEVFELNCGQTPKAYRAHLFAPAHKVSVAPEYTPCNIT